MIQWLGKALKDLREPTLSSEQETRCRASADGWPRCVLCVNACEHGVARLATIILIACTRTRTSPLQLLAKLVDSPRMRTGIVAVLVVAMMATISPAHAVAGHGRSGAGRHWSWGLIRLPLFMFHLRTRSAPTSEGAPEHQAQLASSKGWSTVGFPVRAQGRGFFLRVAGRAEFDRAEVVFADGGLSTFELRGARRGKGIYELARWNETREVICVRMRARACTNQAQLELLIGE